MKADIPEDLIDRMMVKCGRRCCICRRFRPTKLQVHHIRERGQGGGNDEDNLIVTCLSCHTDVHSKVPFARRFSWDELKGHRDALIVVVARGIFPIDDTDDTDEAIATVVDRLRSSAGAKPELMPEAVEMLLRAANTEGNRQGMIIVRQMNNGTTFIAGERAVNTPGERRAEARYRRSFRQLEDCGLVELEPESQSVYSLTHSGYLLADELAARGEQALLAEEG